MRIPSLREILIAYGPGQISRLITRKRLTVLFECIRNLDIQTGAPVTVGGTAMRSVKFANGIELIGHQAIKGEKKILSEVAREFGLDSSYGKILLDAVTRYTYPHCGGAVLQMEWPVESRHMFHPQQKNFLLEEKSLPIEIRQKISDHFRPQSGWHCLDVGAFLGHGATWLRQQVGDTGKVICIEANSHNQQVIDEHMNRNGFANVQSKFAAIWHTAGESVTFNLTARQANAIDNEVVGASRSVEVPTVSIPSLTGELGRPADFLSLTVNGAEIEAIEGIRKLDPADYPKRIISPGWYEKDGRKRIEFIKPILDELGYNYVITDGLLAFAWLDKSIETGS